MIQGCSTRISVNSSRQQILCIWPLGKSRTSEPVELFLLYESMDEDITLWHGTFTNPLPSSIYFSSPEADKPPLPIWSNSTTKLRASRHDTTLQFGAPFTSYLDWDKVFGAPYAGKYRNGSYIDQMLETEVKDGSIITCEYDGIIQMVYITLISLDTVYESLDPSSSRIRPCDNSLTQFIWLTPSSQFLGQRQATHANLCRFF